MAWPSYEDADHSLAIVAPYLQHLKISGCIHYFEYRVVNVSSLVSAELTFYIRCVSQLPRGFVYVEDDSCRDYHHVFWKLVQDYLRKLGHVTELTIGTWFAEVLFILQLDGVQLPELKCKYLTLKLYITKCNLYGVASLLRASPHVKTLNIDMEDDLEANENCRYDSSYSRQGDNIDLESWISNFAFPSLKSVNIICSTGMCQMEQHDKLFEISEFLLKKAMVLEKFVIIAKRTHCCYCLKNCVSPYSSRLAAKLLGCPRPSTNFTMIFAELDFP